MLDGTLRKHLDPALNALARSVAATGIGANAITVAGLVIGLAAAAAIALHWYLAGLALLLLSRLCDGLDGPVARITGKTDFGGYLDITLDFAFYGAIPLGFVIADPSANALAGATLIFSFYVNGASFLAFAIMAEKRKLSTEERGDKSLFFTTGLAEATETIAVFAIVCLFPAWFPAVAWVFAAICFYTALSRILLARRALAD